MGISPCRERRNTLTAALKPRHAQTPTQMNMTYRCYPTGQCVIVRTEDLELPQQPMIVMQPETTLE
jgi:hypothetical protein